MNTVLSHSILDVVSRAAAQLETVRAQKPRVHCITNAAAQVFTANLLLAAGAIPSLTIAADEVPFFTARASGLLVNVGTLDAERRAAIPLAVTEAQRVNKPWILDPVFVDASPPRLAYAQRLIELRPTIIRCNEQEFKALSGAGSNLDRLQSFARDEDCVVALTGAVDRITDGRSIISIRNGHPWMSQTTAMGCAGTALIAALAGIGASPFDAAVSGLIIIGVAGEIAAAKAEGPGTFVPQFLDTLASLSQAQLMQTARIDDEG